ncbi:MAG TPA: DUF481 domain-containing protein [Rhodanobacteraceae bacterium]|nr:DUF481 domain-containing protein [Rhodanobacteraceae bacterium]
MRTHLLVPLLTLALLPAAACADDSTTLPGSARLPTAATSTGWNGEGQLGLAATTGNTRSQSLNAGLKFSYEDSQWKDTFDFSALRSRGEVSTATIVNGQPVTFNRFAVTANRYTFDAASGLKLDNRNALFSDLRYDHDDFSPYRYQTVVSVGYDRAVIKTPATELAFEAGPGYKRYREAGISQERGALIGRGLMAFRHQLTASTRIEDHLLIEAASFNTYTQNDASLVVDMNKRLALKVGYQVRHNSNIGAAIVSGVATGNAKTDTLLTTNLVYNF